MNAPKIRFSEFKDDWKISTFDTVFTIIDGDRGKNYPNSNDFHEEGYCLFLNAKNVTKNGFSILTKMFINKLKDDSMTKGKLKRSDIVLTTRGTVGNVAYYSQEIPFSNIRINSGMLIVRSIITEPLYNYIYMTSNNFTKSIKFTTFGSAQPQLTVKDVKKMKISYPNQLKEQKKIASFFMLLNQKIEKQQEKIEKLEELKKGMMQKIFSQELRFKDENGGEFPEWETTILKDEVDFFNNQRQPITENLRQKGKYPYYGATGIIDYVKEYIFEGEYLLLAEDGANIITRSAPVVYKTKNKFWVNNHAHIMKPKPSNDFNFFYQVLENINYIPYNSGTAQPKLNVESVKKITLIIPKYKEQRKIGVLLSSIDNKIEKEKEKLMVLKSQKKGFMQGMFV